MDKHSVYIIALATLIVASVATLSALNENRLDAYFSIFTIEYLVLTATLRPRRRTRDYLLVALVTVFMYIVAVRVLEILYG